MENKELILEVFNAFIYTLNTVNERNLDKYMPRKDIIALCEIRDKASRFLKGRDEWIKN